MLLSGDVIVDFLTIDEAHVRDLLMKKKSFIIESVPLTAISKAVGKIERLIDECGMRSRVYKKGRSTLVAAAAIPTIPTIAVGVSTAAFIAGHTAATFNPDYEIATNMATGTLTINYTKWESLAAATSSVSDAVGSAAGSVSDAVGSATTKLKNKIFG